MHLHIKFSIKPDIAKELVVRKICTIINNHIKLPETVIIEFKQLENNNHAQTHFSLTHGNKIILNSTLSRKDLIIPLVHELIHLNQIHTKKLSMGKKKEYVWEGRMYKVKDYDYTEYSELPWEVDVRKRLPELLKMLLDFSL